MHEIIRIVPIPIAGVALGLVALGNLLFPVSEVLSAVLAAVSTCLIILLGLKIVMYPRLIREDLKNPILASVSATLFMTLMQLAVYVTVFSFETALVLWCVAILAHFCLLVWFSARFILRFDLKQVFPSYFILYVGIIVASYTSPAFGMEALGRVIFWFGFVCYLSLLVLVTYRYLKHDVPESAQPLFCIYAAPMSLSLSACFAVFTELSAVVVSVMVVLAQLFLILVLANLPKFLRLAFYPSLAAMTFPFVISASALARATHFFASLGGIPETLLAVLNTLVSIETILATVMVLYVFTRYLQFFFRTYLDRRAEVVMKSTNQNIRTIQEEVPVTQITTPAVSPVRER